MHGGGSYLAWNVGKVLHAVKSLGDHLFHKLGPVLAGLDPDDGFVVFVHNPFDALVVHVDDDAVENGLGEQNVVSAAEHQDFLVLEFASSDKGLEAVDIVDFNELLGYNIEAEAVVGFEVDVCFHGCKYKQ